MIENAEWVIHIDVDEFINIRVGNGTLADFFDRVPDATNVAMTWRLFGHNGVEAFKDELVIDQFDQRRAEILPEAPHRLGLQDHDQEHRRLREAVVPPAEQARRHAGAADQMGQRLGPAR